LNRRRRRRRSSSKGTRVRTKEKEKPKPEILAWLSLLTTQSITPIPNLNLHIYKFFLEYGPALAAFLLSNTLFTTLKQKEVQQRC